MVEFAGIADFIAEPLRTYSSGMVMRLVFSVGDRAFQVKCAERMASLKRSGKTLLCVCTPRSDVVIEADIDADDAIEVHPVQDYQGTLATEKQVVADYMSLHDNYCKMGENLAGCVPAKAH